VNDLGLIPRRSWDFFLFATVSRLVLGPTQPPIQGYRGGGGAPFCEVKRPGREAGHSPTSSAEGKNAWNYKSTPPYVFMVWYLVKHRDNFRYLVLTGFAPKCCWPNLISVRIGSI
jgi:hypothetical protein